MCFSKNTKSGLLLQAKNLPGFNSCRLICAYCCWLIIISSNSCITPAWILNEVACPFYYNTKIFKIYNLAFYYLQAWSIHHFNLLWWRLRQYCDNVQCWAIWRYISDMLLMIVRLIFKSKNTVHNRFIMQPKNMGNYFHLRTKRYYHN